MSGAQSAAMFLCLCCHVAAAFVRSALGAALPGSCRQSSTTCQAGALVDCLAIARRASRYARACSRSQRRPVAWLRACRCRWRQGARIGQPHDTRSSGPIGRRDRATLLYESPCCRHSRVCVVAGITKGGLKLSCCCRERAQVALHLRRGSSRTYVPRCEPSAIRCGSSQRDGRVEGSRAGLAKGRLRRGAPSNPRMHIGLHSDSMARGHGSGCVGNMAREPAWDVRDRCVDACALTARPIWRRTSNDRPKPAPDWCRSESQL